MRRIYENHGGDMYFDIINSNKYGNIIQDVRTHSTTTRYRIVRGGEGQMLIDRRPTGEVFMLPKWLTST